VIGFLPITLRACRPHLTAAQGLRLRATRILRLPSLWRIALHARKSLYPKMSPSLN